MKNSNKKIVLITGGSSGVGYEMASQMDDKGYKVVICGRSQVKLDAISEKRPSIDSVQCDISTQDARLTLMKYIKTTYGRLDLLINNAGITKRYHFSQVTDFEASVEEEWRINYLAPLSLMKLFMPLLEATKGRIVNVTSGLVYVPLFVEPNYCATKAALHSFTQSLRFHIEGSGVQLSEIFYPEMNTPFQGGHQSTLALEPDEAAALAIKGIESGKEEIRIKRANILFILSRLMPRRAVKLLNGMVMERAKEVFGL